MKAWLASAWRWLVAVAVAVPGLAALYLWGSGWKQRARNAERRAEAVEASEAATRTRLQTEERVRQAQSHRIQELQTKLTARRERIAQREEEVSQFDTPSAFNAAFGLEDGDG